MTNKLWVTIMRARRDARMALDWSVHALDGVWCTLTVYIYAVLHAWLHVAVDTALVYIQPLSEADYIPRFRRFRTQQQCWRQTRRGFCLQQAHHRVSILLYTSIISTRPSIPNSALSVILSPIHVYVYACVTPRWECLLSFSIGQINCVPHVSAKRTSCVRCV